MKRETQDVKGSGDLLLTTHVLRICLWRFFCAVLVLNCSFLRTVSIIPVEVSVRLMTQKTIVAGAMRNMAHETVLICCAAIIAAAIVPPLIITAPAIVPAGMDPHMAENAISVATVMAFMTGYATIDRLFVGIPVVLKVVAADTVIAATGVLFMTKETPGVLVGISIAFVDFNRGHSSRETIEHCTVCGAVDLEAYRLFIRLIGDIGGIADIVSRKQARSAVN